MAANSLTDYHVYLNGMHAAAAAAHKRLCAERDAAISDAHTVRGSAATRQAAIQHAFVLTWQAVVLERMIADEEFDAVSDRCPMEIGEPFCSEVAWCQTRADAARARLERCQPGTADFRDNRELAELYDARVTFLNKLVILRILYPVRAAEEGAAGEDAAENAGAGKTGGSD